MVRAIWSIDIGAVMPALPADTRKRSMCASSSYRCPSMSLAVSKTPWPLRQTRLGFCCLIYIEWPAAPQIHPDVNQVQCDADASAGVSDLCVLHCSRLRQSNEIPCLFTIARGV